MLLLYVLVLWSICSNSPRHCYVCTNNSSSQKQQQRQQEQQSIELYHHAGIHVIETAAKVVFAAVLGSIPVPVPGTWCVLYEYQIRGVLLSPTWYIRLHWYQVPGCIRVRSMLDMILLSEIAPMRRNTERCHVSRKSKAPAAGLNAFANYATSASISQMILR